MNRNEMKHPQKNYKEFIKRQEQRGEPISSYDEYLELHKFIAVDRGGKLNPLKQRGFEKMLLVFGDIVLKLKKTCLHCGKRKRYIDFIVRWKDSSIENICRDCEQIRKSKYD